MLAQQQHQKLHFCWQAADTLLVDAESRHEWHWTPSTVSPLQSDVRYLYDDPRQETMQYAKRAVSVAVRNTHQIRDCQKTRQRRTDEVASRSHEKMHTGHSMQQWLAASRRTVTRLEPCQQLAGVANALLHESDRQLSHLKQPLPCPAFVHREQQEPGYTKASNVCTG